MVVVDVFFWHASSYDFDFDDFCDFQWTAVWVVGDPGQNAQQVVEVAAKRGPGRIVGTSNQFMKKCVGNLEYLNI